MLKNTDVLELRELCYNKKYAQKQEMVDFEVRLRFFLYIFENIAHV